MRTARTLLACALLAGALAVPVSAEGKTSGGKAIDYLNQMRKRHGLRPFGASHDLSRTSRAFAIWQMRQGRFGHRARVSCSRRWRSAGEAIAIYTGWDLRWRWVIRRWLNSPSHRGILLNSRFRWVGIGADRGYFHGRRATIWVLQAGGR